MYMCRSSMLPPRLKTEFVTKSSFLASYYMKLASPCVLPRLCIASSQPRTTAQSVPTRTGCVQILKAHVNTRVRPGSGRGLVAELINRSVSRARGSGLDCRSIRAPPPNTTLLAAGRSTTRRPWLLPVLRLASWCSGTWWMSSYLTPSRIQNR